MAIGISSSFNEEGWDGDDTSLRAEIARLREENEQLRSRLNYLEFEAADSENGLILTLKGKISRYGSEYSAWYLNTTHGGVYLCEAIKDFVERLRHNMGVSKSALVTLAWHITAEPKTHMELQENLAKCALGDVQTTFSHAFSDLTGYLWTDEAFKAGGRDILEEMELKDGRYLYLRAQVHTEEG